MDQRIHLPAVIAAALAGMVIGFLWYSPLLFEAQWLSLSGRTLEEVQSMLEQNAVRIYVTGFMCLFVISYSMAWILARTNVSGVEDALMTAFWVWAGLIFAVFAGSVLWSGSSPALFLLNAMHYLIVLATISVILTKWKKPA